MISEEETVIIAMQAHAGQLDKAGDPYYTHPLRVGLAFPPGTTERLVGYLHDVVEDTPIKLYDLQEMGFSQEILDAVEAITKWGQPHETNREYLIRCRQNKIAKEVKKVDIADNMSPVRQAKLDEKTSLGLRKKYEKDLKLLLE
jgi:(p)ppGpp synthase/HD superfamily hydrolase